MKTLNVLAAFIALSLPAAAMAAETPTVPSTPTAAMTKNASTETIAIVGKAPANSFIVPKALTAQQINDKHQRELDLLFNMPAAFHSP